MSGDEQQVPPCLGDSDGEDDGDFVFRPVGAHHLEVGKKGTGRKPECDKDKFAQNFPAPMLLATPTQEGAEIVAVIVVASCSDAFSIATATGARQELAREWVVDPKPLRQTPAQSEVSSSEHRQLRGASRCLVRHFVGGGVDRHIALEFVQVEGARPRLGPSVELVG